MTNMPKYQFHILCNDVQNTCDWVMKNMEEVYETKAKRLPIDIVSGDHYIEKECKDTKSAFKFGDEIEKKYADYISLLTVIPK